MKKLIVISAMLAAVAAASWGQTGGAEALGDSCVEAHDTFHALQYYGEAMAADSSAALQRKVARCHYMRGDYRRCIDTMLPVAGPGGDSLTLEQMRYMFDSYKMLADNDGQMTGAGPSCAGAPWTGK